MFVARDVDNGMEIEVLDDGHGLNLERISDRAMALGIVCACQKLSREETAELIFLSGFSTTSEVGLISGRGVGMDAMRASLTRIGGSMRIKLRDEKALAAWSLVLTFPESQIIRREKDVRTLKVLAEV